MTDAIQPTDPVLDPSDLEAYENALADALRRRNWTDLRQVKLGAAISGVQRVVVPDSVRKSPYEVYYTELDNSGYGTVINASSATPNQYNLLVFIGHPPTDRDRWHVYARVVNNEIDQQTVEPGTVPHAPQHTLRNAGFDGSSSVGYVGEDPVFIDDRQLVSVSLMPGTGLTARLTPGWISFNGTRKWFGGAEIDLSSAQPGTSGQARYVLVEVDSDLAVQTSNGSTYSYALPGAALSTFVPSGSASRYQAGAVCLRNGDIQLTWTHIWAGMGLRRVGGGHIVQDNGTDETQRTNLNFADGDGISVTVTDDSGSDRSTVSPALDIPGMTEGTPLASYHVVTTDGTVHRKSQIEDLPITEFQPGAEGYQFLQTRTAVSANASTDGAGLYEVDTTSGAVTLTLASVDTVAGRRVTVKDIGGSAGANAITVDTEGSETIDGAASQTISTNYGVLRLYVSSDNNWYTM